MKKSILFLIFCTFTTCAMFLSGCDQIIEPTLNTGGKSLSKIYETRPFTANLLYTLLSQVNDTVSVWSGTGNVTHLGNCTVIDTAVDHYTTTSWTVVGNDWITAANGDLIHFTWFMDYYDPTTWVWAIVGGTGRFAGATGSGTYDAGYTNSGDIWGKFVGSIMY